MSEEAKPEVNPIEVMNQRIINLEKAFENLPNMLNEVLEKNLAPFVQQSNARLSMIESRLSAPTTTTTTTGGFNWGEMIGPLLKGFTSPTDTMGEANRKLGEQITNLVLKGIVEDYSKRIGIPIHEEVVHLGEHP